MSYPSIRLTAATGNESKTSTMASPEVSIKRSWGWTTPLWEAKKPILQRSVAKATMGMGYLGIRWDEPKIGRVVRYKCIDGLEEDGFAVDALNFTLNVVTNKGETPRAVRRAAEWSSVIVHEIVHCARMEEVGGQQLVERVATEGLAYLGEHGYIEKFCSKQVLSRFFSGCDFAKDPVLHEGFLAIQDVPYVYGSASLEWFSAKTILDVPNGALFGVQRVHHQLERGHTLADLVRQPAGDVLGL